MGNSVLILLLLLTLVSQWAVSSSLENYPGDKEAEGHFTKASQHIISESAQDEAHDKQSHSSYLDSKSTIQNHNRNNPKFNIEASLFFERILVAEKAKLMESSSELGALGNPTESLNYNELHKGTNCSWDVMYVIQAARMELRWALEMIDSTGKPESGTLRGNTYFVGDYDECMDVETGLAFEGRYCVTNIWISEFQNTSLVAPLKFQLGLCLPSSCDATDVEEYINSYVQSRPDVTAIAAGTYCQERNLTLTTKAKVVICICSLFIALMMVSTIYDVFYKRLWLERERHSEIPYNQDKHMATSITSAGSKRGPSECTPIIDPREETPKFYSNHATAVPDKEASVFYNICDQLLMTFSVYTNTSKLFTIHQSQGSIDCIHGMRFLSTAGIILFHTNIMGRGALANVGPFLDDAYNNWAFLPVWGASIAVDTFFAIGGLLLTYVVLKKLLKEQPTPKFLAIFYLHRFLRITPPYMLVLMTYVPLFKYLSDGPFWPQRGLDTDFCDDTWWTNLLYVNNFVKMWKPCMSWSWYLACDMQFYLVSPLLFLPMFFYEWKGFIVAFAFLLGNVICSGVITDSKGIALSTDFENIRQITMEAYYRFKYYYAKPYTRIGPFIIGMMTGFLLYKFQCKARLSKLVVVVGWMLATATALAVVYGLDGQVSPEDTPSTEVRALYNALHRVAWGMCVCWVIFACVNGYGGFVNTLLSWKVFIPLSRLSYCAYLVHPLVIQFYFYSQRRLFYMNYFNVTFAFLAMLTVSYALAYIVYMAYEIPLAGLDKVITGRGWRTSVKQ